MKKDNTQYTKTETTHGLTKVKADILGIVKIDGLYYYKVSYADYFCYVKLLPFELQILDTIKQMTSLDCVYLGLDENASPRLIRDKCSYIDDLYEEDTVQKFTYVNSSYEYNDNVTKEYHRVKDDYGLKHRFYGELSEEQKVYGTELELYIKRIDSRTKNLSLALYNPNLDYAEKEWYSADRIFQEIDEINNKEQYFDLYFSSEHIYNSKLEKDMVCQYNGYSNLWLFTYLNILDNELVCLYIEQRNMEELAVVSRIMIKLQEWILEKSEFLDSFSEDTKSDTIKKSTSQIQKYRYILIAIDIVKESGQYKYIDNIVSSIKTSGCIECKEQMEILSYILKIYPDYIIQDVDSTCELIQALLVIEEDVDRYYIDNIVFMLNYYIEYNIRKIRKTSIRTNDIDTSQTLSIMEILTLLGVKILIYSNGKYYDEMQCRESKARFFRFLSFICASSIQSSILKAAINSLVGVLNDSEIFTWNNVKRINVIRLANLTVNAAVLDCNLDNDFYFKSTKTGVLSLDPTGFTIVPYKQCISTLISRVDSLGNVNIIHNVEVLPIKLGSMYNIRNIVITDNPIEQYIVWNELTKNTPNIANDTKPVPKVGDVVKIMVKEQNQTDKLKFMIFVKVIDNRYQSVEGAILVNEISSKWIDDARTIFKPGDVFFATVCGDNGKYSFSIKSEVDRYSTVLSSASDDAYNIVLNKSRNAIEKQLPKGFIQELILLVDMYIRKENDMRDKLTLIGYAYCLSALLGNPKSYYYDFMLCYFAHIEKFITGNCTEISIPLSISVEKHFKGLSDKISLIKMLSLTNGVTNEGLQSLSSLALHECNNNVGKIASMLLSYLYAQRANLSFDLLRIIKSEINTFIGNADNIDFSALEYSNKGENFVSMTDFGTEENSNEIYSPEFKEINSIENNFVEDENNKDGNEFHPLKINILDNNNVAVNEIAKNIRFETSVLEILIKDYAKFGYVLLVNNQGWICKIPVTYINKLGRGTFTDKCINPYKLNNHFVVPSDCLIGLVISTQADKLIEIWNTADIPCSEFDSVEYQKPQFNEFRRCQAFILPTNTVMDEYCNKSINSDAISQNVKELIESYGVII